MVFYQDELDIEKAVCDYNVEKEINFYKFICSIKKEGVV